MEYHHIGIPTTHSDPEEGYDSRFKYHSWGYERSEFHIQWHRFEPDAPFHKMILTTPHIAFRVPSITPYLDKYPVIMEPFFPVPHFQAAMIAVDDTPVELCVTELTDDILVKEHKKNIGQSSTKAPEKLTYTYHYFAIPRLQTDPHFTLSSLSPHTNPFGTQHFSPSPDLPELIRTVPHAAFLVPDLAAALKNRTLILPPQPLTPTSKIAFINEVDAPIALIQNTSH